MCYYIEWLQGRTELHYQGTVKTEWNELINL